MKIILSLMSTVLLSVAIFSQTGSDANQPKNTGFNTVSVYTSAQNTMLRISPGGKFGFSPAEQPLESEVSVFVNTSKTFQTFLGIGGAITDASAEVFAKLPAEKQNELLTAYFSKEKGIGYSLLRTTIHSCDFSPYSYTYIEEGDKELTTFTIEHDLRFRIPMIKKAIQYAGGTLLLYVSPWSPPAFMKDNLSMLRGGKLQEEYKQPWANYYVKFIREYEKCGIPVWGLTIQNEPMAVQRWESCIYSAGEERDFLKYYLGPTLEKAGMSDKKIVVWDHNRDLINHRANTIFSDPGAAKYAWGMGFHWYETWAGGQPMFENLNDVKESFPGIHLLFTEGCVENFSSERYQYWPNAERYGKSMINDLNNGACGWTDWNILLDETGGPNHVQNFCFAPVHADTRDGSLIFTPSYYYIGHFSKFIRPGAKRMSTSCSRSHLLATSFVNDDKSMVTIVMNQSNEEIKYKLFVDEQLTELTIPAHAIQTVVY